MSQFLGVLQYTIWNFLSLLQSSRLPRWRANRVKKAPSSISFAVLIIFPTNYLPLICAHYVSLSHLLPAGFWAVFLLTKACWAWPSTGTYPLPPPPPPPRPSVEFESQLSLGGPILSLINCYLPTKAFLAAFWGPVEPGRPYLEPHRLLLIPRSLLGSFLLSEGQLSQQGPTLSHTNCCLSRGLLGSFLLSESLSWASPTVTYPLKPSGQLSVEWGPILSLTNCYLTPEAFWANFCRARASWAWKPYT